MRACMHVYVTEALVCKHTVAKLRRHALLECQKNWQVLSTLAVASATCKAAPHSRLILTHLLLTGLHLLVSRQVAIGGLSAAASCQPSLQLA